MYVCMYVLHSFLTIPDTINITTCMKVQQTLYILHVQCTYQFFFAYCKIARSENFTLQLCKICTCNTIVSFWRSMTLLFTITIQIVAEKQKFRKTPFNYAQKKNYLMRSKVGTVLHTAQCMYLRIERHFGITQHVCVLKVLAGVSVGLKVHSLRR